MEYKKVNYSVFIDSQHGSVYDFVHYDFFDSIDNNFVNDSYNICKYSYNIISNDRKITNH